MNLFDVYPLFDITIDRGKGAKVWDDKGEEYLNPLQQEVADKLGKLSGYEDYQLFLINSGAEANENALKLASFYNKRTRVLAIEKAFHGRTSLAVEATNNPKIIAPVNANNHVTFLPINDLSAWEAEINKGDVCACIIECIQGVGGIRLVDKDFLYGIQKLCEAHNTVLICDEIQCGYGRSGKFFAHQHLGVKAREERSRGGRASDEKAERSEPASCGRRSRTRTDDWHRARYAIQRSALRIAFQGALLHWLFRHQCHPSAATALPHH